MRFFVLRRHASAAVAVSAISFVLVQACVGSDPDTESSSSSSGGNGGDGSADGTGSSSGGSSSGSTSDGGGDAGGPPAPEDKTRWATQLSFTQVGEGYAVARDGSTYAIGTFYGSVTIGNVTLMSQGGSNDVWIAKLDANGGVVWAKSYGGTGDQRGYRITVLDDAGGDIVIAGTTDEHFDIPNPGSQGVAVNFPKRGGTTMFFARLGGNDGAPRWAQWFGDDYDAGFGLGTGPNFRFGSLVASKTTLAFTGRYDNTFFYVDGAGATVKTPAASAFSSNFVAVFDQANGRVTKMVTPLESISEFVAGAAPDGDILLAGRCAGTQFAVGGKQYDATASGKNASGCAARLDPTMTTARWVTGWGSIGAGAIMAVEAISMNADRVAVGGWYAGTAEFVAGASSSANQRDAYVVALDAADGVSKWSSTFGGSTEDDTFGVAVDPWGQVVMAGFYSSTNATLGGAAAPPPIGTNNAFAMKLDHDGKLVWSKVLFAKTPPASGNARINFVGAFPNGDFVAGGPLQGKISAGLANDIVTGNSGAQSNLYAIRWTP